MKKIFTFLTTVFITVNVFSQTPNKLSYQAVIRNSANTLVTNTQIGMQISILQGSISGTAVFVETHTPTSNANGMIGIEIGGGTVVSGDFTTLDWANGPYFIKTESDPEGGVNYSITGTSQLLSVPYALYAKTAGLVQTGGQTVILNDSLVMKDSLGVVRMVLNPNTGTFKMMNNDTVWYSMRVNSPKIDYLQLDGGKYFVSKEENGAKIMELYQNGNLIGRSTETQDYDGTLYRTTKTIVDEEFGFNPNTGTYQKVRETKTENEDYLNIDDHNSSTTVKLFNNGQVHEETTVYEKYASAPTSDHSQINHNIVYDSQGEVLRDTKTEFDLINHTKKMYIKEFFGGTERYFLVEEKYNTEAFETTESVKDTSENGTTTRLAKDKFSVSNSNPNAKSFEYSYDNATNSTQLNYVDGTGTKTNIATMDHLGNVEYGPNNAIKTNYLGETFTNNAYVAGDLLITGNTDVYGDLNVSGTKNFRITHPNDAKKYLVHAAVESNEALNSYSGNTITDNQGIANVSLPDYFGEINTDFRYVLTVVGQTFAQAIIYQEIDTNNQFVIKTNEPNIKVSWQILAKRNDRYLQKHPFLDIIPK